jgi:UvrD/REP helicase N-terminal domain/UvrD-like helicase C-terminal domain
MSCTSIGSPPSTAEQRAIVDTCPLPPVNDHRTAKRPGQLTIVTAAAGTGKTSTLIAFILEAWKRGHDKIVYITFTKEAARECEKRVHAAVEAVWDHLRQQPGGCPRPLPTIEVSTLHSLAYRLSRRRFGATATEEQAHKHSLAEKEIREWIGDVCTDQISSFLKPCYADIASRALPNDKLRCRQQQARDQVVFFIYKSLVRFCRSNWTLQQYETGSVNDRDYYPAVKFHCPTGDGHSYGFSPDKYNNKRSIGFYADQASMLWSLIVSKDVRSCDFDMKRVQFFAVRVPGTIVLVDESQDLDACQVDWVGRQQVVLHRLPVIMVGDCAQAIYGFRGAKPEYLMSLKCTQHFSLVESWRFGPAISNIVNLILFCKQHSDQTRGDKTTWIPYRTKPGLPNKVGVITTESLIQLWKDLKVTLIARTNATLLLEMLGLLGFSLASDGGEEGDKGNRSSSKARVVSVSLTDSDDEYIGNNTENSILSLEIPKVHIVGNGEQSGLNLWKSTLKLVEAVYGLYLSHCIDSAVEQAFDSSLFPDFTGRTVTWTSFYAECEQKELSEYYNVIIIVSICEHDTLAAMKVFQEEFMDKMVSPEEADIILTTCHSAKGKEWDNVQVCDDFVELCSFAKKERTPASLSTPDDEASTKRPKLSDSWQFNFKGWGDDVNLWYVALTRAKSMLSIPPRFLKLLEAFDDVHEWEAITHDADAVNTVAVSIPGCGKDTMTEDDAHCFYNSLILPLREEYGMKPDQLLKDTLINFDHDDNDQFRFYTQLEG